MTFCVLSIVYQDSCIDIASHYRHSAKPKAHGPGLMAKKNIPLALPSFSVSSRARGGSAVFVPIRREAWERRTEAEHQGQLFVWPLCPRSPTYRGTEAEPAGEKEKPALRVYTHRPSFGTSESWAARMLCWSMNDFYVAGTEPSISFRG